MAISAKPLKPFTMSGNLMRVPTLRFNRDSDVAICAGCVHREGEIAPNQCNEARCRSVVREGALGEDGVYDDFILINPAKVDEYKAVYAAMKLTGELDEDSLDFS